MLEQEYCDTFGIDEIGTISLSLAQMNAAYSVISEESRMEITIPDAKAKFDSAGTIVYSKNGLKLISKAIVPDTSDYSDDLHVFLIAENNTGKAITIDDSYDSASVNGFMLDIYTFYSVQLDDGESAVLDITLWDNSLEDLDIKSASDISNFEIGFKIYEGDGWNKFDEPTVNVTFS